MSDNDVKAVNRGRAMAMLDCGCFVPITEWFGEDGEDCAPDDAIVCVAGDDDHGWFTIDLVAFPVVTER